MKVYQRLDALTSLRFFAAAMIVIYHIEAYDGLWGFDKSNPPVLPWALGVSFFFVLSGFILTYIYPKLDTWTEIRHFWRARIARIWPALFVSFLLALWLLSLDWEYKTGIANLLMVNAWIPYPIYYYSYNSPSWSISTEFFFYLAFPLLIYRWRKNWPIKILVSCLIFVFLIALSNLLKLPAQPSMENQGITRFALFYIHPISRIYEFIFGMLVATFWLKRVERAQWSISRATLYEVGAVLLTITTMHFNIPLAKWIGSTWLGTGTSQWLSVSGIMFVFGLLIYVMAIGRGRISAWLSHPYLVLLGEISLSVYLLHQILLRYYVGNAAFFPKVPNLISLTTFWVFLLLASYVMWSLVEMPSRRLILGRGQKDIHGTKVMKESWHSHLNLNRKTLPAAIVLFCMASAIDFALENNSSRISESEANMMTPLRMRTVVGTGFGGRFLLRGVKVEPQKEGLLITLAWESMIAQELNYTVLLDLTDINGSNLYSTSLKQPRTRTAEKRGALWQQSLLIPSEKLNGLEKKLAISLYQADSKPLTVDRGDRDRDNSRLLVDLGDVNYPARL